MKKYVENREPLLIVAKIPAANLVHAVQLGQLIESQYRGSACVVDAVYGRTVIGQNELASFEVQ